MTDGKKVLHSKCRQSYQFWPLSPVYALLRLFQCFSSNIVFLLKYSILPRLQIRIIANESFDGFSALFSWYKQIKYQFKHTLSLCVAQRENRKLFIMSMMSIMSTMSIMLFWTQFSISFLFSNNFWELNFFLYLLIDFCWRLT